MYSKIIQSSVGQIEIIADDHSILSVSFVKERKNTFRHSNHLCDLAAKKLELYFLGKIKSFNLPIKFKGTEFQNKVWKALCQIPYGETWSYQDIAIKIGNKNSCRAVGGANNKNPLGIIVPCHRVVGKNGSMVGYAGGIDYKVKLLQLEMENKYA